MLLFRRALLCTILLLLALATKAELIRYISSQPDSAVFDHDENWSTGKIPSVDDDVVIEIPLKTGSKSQFVMTFSQNSAVRSLRLRGLHLRLEKTLSITNLLDIGTDSTLSISGGTVMMGASGGGDARVLVQGQLALRQGRLEAVAQADLQVMIEEEGKLTCTGPGANTLKGANVTINSEVKWRSGPLLITGSRLWVGPKGVLRASSRGSLGGADGAGVDLLGRMEWSEDADANPDPEGGGDLVHAFDVPIHVHTDGVMEVQGGAVVQGRASLTNEGTIDVAEGNLTLLSPEFHQAQSGSVEVADNALFSIQGGVSHIQGRVAGQGTVVFGPSQIYLGAELDCFSLDVVGSSIKFNDSLPTSFLANKLHLFSGSMVGRATVRVGPGGAGGASKGLVHVHHSPAGHTHKVMQQITLEIAPGSSMVLDPEARIHMDDGSSVVLHEDAHMAWGPRSGFTTSPSTDCIIRTHKGSQWVIDSGLEPPAGTNESPPGDFGTEVGTAVASNGDVLVKGVGRLTFRSNTTLDKINVSGAPNIVVVGDGPASTNVTILGAHTTASFTMGLYLSTVTLLDPKFELTDMHLWNAKLIAKELKVIGALECGSDDGGLGAVGVRRLEVGRLDFTAGLIDAKEVFVRDYVKVVSGQGVKELNMDRMTLAPRSRLEMQASSTLLLHPGSVIHSPIDTSIDIFPAASISIAPPEPEGAHGPGLTHVEDDPHDEAPPTVLLVEGGTLTFHPLPPGSSSPPGESKVEANIKVDGGHIKIGSASSEEADEAKVQTVTLSGALSISTAVEVFKHMELRLLCTKPAPRGTFTETTSHTEPTCRYHSVTGAGGLAIVSGHHEVEHPSTIHSLRMEGGQLVMHSTVVVENLQLSGGVLAGYTVLNSSITVLEKGEFDGSFSTGSHLSMEGASLIVLGDMEWTGSGTVAIGGGARLEVGTGASMVVGSVDPVEFSFLQGPGGGYIWNKGNMTVLPEAIANVHTDLVNSGFLEVQGKLQVLSVFENNGVDAVIKVDSNGVLERPERDAAAALHEALVVTDGSLELAGTVRGSVQLGSKMRVLSGASIGGQLVTSHDSTVVFACEEGECTSVDVNTALLHGNIQVEMPQIVEKGPAVVLIRSEGGTLHDSLHPAHLQGKAVTSTEYAALRIGVDGGKLSVSVVPGTTTARKASTEESPPARSEAPTSRKVEPDQPKAPDYSPREQVPSPVPTKQSKVADSKWAANYTSSKAAVSQQIQPAPCTINETAWLVIVCLLAASTIALAVHAFWTRQNPKERAARVVRQGAPNFAADPEDAIVASDEHPESVPLTCAPDEMAQRVCSA